MCNYMRENNMTQPLISVIVPVYNVEDVLPRCLDSLCMQSLQNIEILLIDDASPDRCGAICEAYAEKDPRFRVIHHPENRGLSAARNTGIAHASADYLMFVDSDDWVHEDFCKLPYECAEQTGADLMMFGYQNVFDTALKHKADSFVKTIRDGYKTRDEAIELSFKAYGMVAWNKLYRKKLFDDINYPVGRLYEDTATTYKLIWKAASIFCLEKILYFYWHRPGSIMGKKPTKQTISEQFWVCWEQYRNLSKWGYKSDGLDGFILNSALSYCMRKNLDFSDKAYRTAADIIESVSRMPRNLTWKRRLLVKMFKVSPTVFNLICRLANKQAG